jgi:hypothetical protein
MNSMTTIGATVLLLLLGVTAPAVAQKEQEPKQEKQEQQAKPQKEQQAKPQRQEQQAKPQKEQQAKPERQQAQAKPQQQERQQEQQQAKGQQEQKQQQAKGQQEQKQQQAKSQQQEKQQQAKTEQGRQQQQQEARTQQGRQQQQQQQAVRRSPQEQHAQAQQQQASWTQNRAHNWKSEHRTWQQRGGYNGYRIPDDRYRGYFGESHSFRLYSEGVEFSGGLPRFQYGGLWFGFVDPWPEYWANDWYENDDVYVVYTDGGYYLYNRRYPRDAIAINVSL